MLLYPFSIRRRWGAEAEWARGSFCCLPATQSFREFMCKHLNILFKLRGFGCLKYRTYTPARTFAHREHTNACIRMSKFKALSLVPFHASIELVFIRNIFCFYFTFDGCPARVCVYVYPESERRPFFTIEAKIKSIGCLCLCTLERRCGWCDKTNSLVFKRG